MGVRKYFKREFQLEMFKLEHDCASDFYVSCWQSNRAVLPLLCIRTLIFLVCLATILTSAIITGLSMPFGYWFIFMTHWGITFNTLATGSALAVSCRAYFGGPIDTAFGLPWYLKVYWSLFNSSVTVAVFITIYYYLFLVGLSDEEGEHEVNAVLDVFVHAINSVLMLLLLMTSRHPARWLHFYHPLGVGLLYLFFSAIYYIAGGTDMFGNPYIYATLDWSAAGETMVMVVFSAVALIAIHLVVVGLTALRDQLARKIRRDSKSLPVSNNNGGHS